MRVTGALLVYMGALCFAAWLMAVPAGHPLAAAICLFLLVGLTSVKGIE